VKYIFSELIIFVKKQASSALFGGLILLGIILSKYIDFGSIYRYDALLLYAIVIQIILIITKAEEPKEILAIIIFHITAMGMEIFKTSPMVGSWVYPENAVLAIGTVPLFTGFMYSSVGSYIARSWRINNFRFYNLPSKTTLFFIGLSIYVNFFTNYFVNDVRYILFIFIVIAFWKTKFYVNITSRDIQIHPLVSNALLAFFVWVAEQISTFASVWVYPNQIDTWRPVSFRMFTSWYFLLIFSFCIIAIIYGKNSSNKNNPIIKN
jgi:uncharacterized membrane protein YoaT (DUF817 family)